MSERPSRQQLVVPPQRSNLPLVLGVVASACMGFGAVWAIGLGRVRGFSADESLDPPIATAADPAVQAEHPEPPERLDSKDEGGREAAVEAHPAPIEPAGDRYAIRRASLDTDVADAPSAVDPPRLSRFSSSEPAGAGVAGEQVPAEPPAEEGSNLGPGVEEQPALEAPIPLDAAHETPSAVGAEATVGNPAAPGGAVLGPVVPADPEEPLPEDVGDLAARAAVPPPAAAPRSSSDIDAPAPLPKPESPVPAPPQRGQAPPQGEFSTAVPAVSVSGNPLRDQAMPVPVPAAVPFAAAPPIVAGADAAIRGGAAGAFPNAAVPSGPPADGGPTGQGRPGPMQLEGVQAPQLTVEKRGPREVQVGKAARYEILVRNVGSATAHDCMLRDSVPYGTTLVATTPPASPANPASASTGDLIWTLGSLPPGGQTRVAMEVLPTMEGDVGSVASVTFRADATVRSRATKPDLRIEAPVPKPVLVGKEVRCTIKITNPGTGVATGVVLEGLLPDGVTHRSGRELEFDVGQLRPGGSRTIELLLGSTGPGVHTVRLVARADGRLEVEQPLRIEVTAPTLELAAEMPTRRYLQRPATCVISMANTGTAPAKSVELAAQLPPGVKFVRANNAGYYDERTHRVLWNLEELPAGDTGSVEVVVMPVDLGPQKIVAAARSADGLSDQIARTIEVEGLAALFFEVADSEDPIEVGGITEYVVRVRNQGTKSASGVRLSATMLGEMEPVEAKGPAAHRIENLSVAFEPLAKLAPAEETVFRIRVRGHREGDQRLQVQLTSDDHPAPITKEEITRVYADR